MNLVKHMSSNTTDRACLAYTRQSAFGRRQTLPRVSYTSTMKQIMGCYHLHIERTQTVRNKSSVGNDRPLSLICLLRSSSFSEAGLQALPSVLTSVHGPACVLLVVVPGPSPLCSLHVTTTPSSFVMHSGSSLGFFLERKAQPDLPPVDNRFSILSPSPAYIPGALPRIGIHTSFRQQCHLPLAHTPNRRTCPRMEH